MKLLVERNSQRSIVRATGVSRMTIAGWIKKVRTKVVENEVIEADVVEADAAEAILGLDEMWTFVGRKKRKKGLWLAVERASRRIVA